MGERHERGGKNTKQKTQFNRRANDSDGKTTNTAVQSRQETKQHEEKYRESMKLTPRITLTCSHSGPNVKYTKALAHPGRDHSVSEVLQIQQLQATLQ